MLPRVRLGCVIATIGAWMGFGLGCGADEVLPDARVRVPDARPADARPDAPPDPPPDASLDASPDAM